MNKSLLIIEFIDEATHLLKLVKENTLRPSQLIIISPNPSVRSLLFKNNIESRDTLQYFSNQSHREGSLKLHHILQKIEQNINIKDELDLSKGHHFNLIHLSQWPITYCLFFIEIYQNALKDHPEINSLITFSFENIIHREPFLNDSERFSFLFAREIAHQFNLKLKAYPLFTESKEDQHPSKNQFKISLLNLLIKLEAKLTLLASSCYFKKKTCLMTTIGRNINYVAEDLKKRNSKLHLIYLRKLEFEKENNYFIKQLQSIFFGLLNILHGLFPLRIFQRFLHVKLSAIINVSAVAFNLKNSHTFKSSLKKSIDRLKENLTQDLTFKGIDFSEFFFNKIDYGISPKLLEYEKIIKACNKIFDKLNPNLLLTIDSVGATSVIGELCRKKSIHGIIISHGSHPIPSDTISAIELERLARGLFNTDYPYAAVQSKLAEQFAHKINLKSKLVKTGPLTWGKVFQSNPTILEKYKIPPHKKILLHAGTSKQRPAIRFFIYETLDEYIDSIKDLIHAVDRDDDLFLIIKFRPRKNLSLEDLKAGLPQSDNYLISVEEKFLDVLLQSDLLISFSSTTMEEAIENNIPVLQYGGGGRMKFLPGEDITTAQKISRSPVYFLKDKIELTKSIKSILDIFSQEKLNENDLKQYILPSRERKNLDDLVN